MFERHWWMGTLTALVVGCAPADEGSLVGVHPSADGAVADQGAAVADASESSTDVGVDAGAPPPIAADAVPVFAFPIHPDDRLLIQPSLFFGVDHDPAEGRDVVCTAYDGRGFPWCYDGHEGSDFLLDGGFATMDAGSARVVAAAGGEVIRVADGNYDRCAGNLEDFEPQCDGHPRRSNRVHLRHANGWVTEYLHLMNGSVEVEEGDRVPCGAVLGRVGSSGRSFAPHLHFEVRGPDDTAIDPFAGEVSGPHSLWHTQRVDDDLPGAACDPAWGAAP